MVKHSIFKEIRTKVTVLNRTFEKDNTEIL